uniref:Uncharacterized protein n=1 Tax=Arundo donax TaxID=35708 RepID=A0A0A8ZID2_ARUDO
MPACMLAGSLLPPRRPDAAAAVAVPAAATLATMLCHLGRRRRRSWILEADKEK